MFYLSFLIICTLPNFTGQENLIYHTAKDNHRIINLYGLIQLNESDVENKNPCAAKVIQVTDKKIYIDKCYLTYNDLLKKYNESDGDMKIISLYKKPQFAKELSTKNIAVLNRIYKMSLKEIKNTEFQTNSRNCDSVHGFDVEVIQENKTHLFNFRYAANCMEKDIANLMKELHEVFVSL